MTGSELRDRLGDHWHPVGGWPAPSAVPLAALIPTQWPHVDPCRLCQQRLGRPIEGDDPHPHVVACDGALFVWDGHTRIARWLRAGHDKALARVTQLTMAASGTPETE